MKLQNLTLLVTGGAGFIGSHLVKSLAKHNQVVIYDNFASATVTKGELASWKNVRVATGDIADTKRLATAMRNIPVVFHLAVACVRKSLAQPVLVHEVNATGTLKTLLAAQQAQVKKFIYISSSEVYGSAQTPIIPETHPIRPTTIYGLSKYLGELYAQQFREQFGLSTVIVRPFNTYGPRSHFEGVYGEVIPRFVLRALSGLPPIIFGSGKQTRDFTYVSDTVSGIIKAAQSDKLSTGPVNIAHGEQVSINKLATTIRALTGLKAKPRHKPARPHDTGRLGADINLAVTVLGYRPQITLSQGLRRYIAWVKHTYPDPAQLLRQIPDRNW